VLSLTQMESIARDWIYPPFRALTIREWTNDAGQILVSIEIGGIMETGALALVLGAGDPPERRLVGAPIRAESRVYNVGVARERSPTCGHAGHDSEIDAPVRSLRAMRGQEEVARWTPSLWRRLRWGWSRRRGTRV
jgi:hypothetical protein